MERPSFIAIVIPCYNEAERLQIHEFQEFLENSAKQTFFLFVNDGSVDNTTEVLDKIKVLKQGHIDVLNLSKNSGKAEAVRQGMIWLMEHQNNFDYAAFMDADLSTPLTQIDAMRKRIVEYNRPAALIGSRVKIFGSTDIQRSEFRHYIGRIIATLISRSLKLSIYDTQCGFKVFRKDMLNRLFGQKFISRWLFDVEILFRLKQIFGSTSLTTQLFEIPVEAWHEKGGSKIPFHYIFRVPIELFKIRSKYGSK